MKIDEWGVGSDGGGQAGCGERGAGYKVQAVGKSGVCKVLQDARCIVQLRRNGVICTVKKKIYLASCNCFVLQNMNSYNDLEIYRLAFDLAVKVHRSSLELPKFELYEQGSQIRRSSKSIKDTISEGYGRRRYKAEYIKFLIYAHSSCDEAQGQLD